MCEEGRKNKNHFQLSEPVETGTVRQWFLRESQCQIDVTSDVVKRPLMGLRIFTPACNSAGVLFLQSINHLKKLTL
jgi:hypothetical protein